VSDIVVLTDKFCDNEALFNNAVHAASFRTPSALILNGLNNVHALRLKRVLVAWNSGGPAACAIRTALPIMTAAKEVTVAVFDPVTTDLRDSDNSGSDMHIGSAIRVATSPSSNIRAAAWR
jgi:hypothetical protein